MKQCAIPVKVHVISAGKFRRYAHLTFWQHFTVPHIVTKNLVDVFKIGFGFLQSLWLLLRFRPDIVFAKGGFVCLPLGLAARLLRIPLVIHDSDTRAGLTNRVLGKWAQVIATGSPLENYTYDPERSVYTGVPIDPKFSPKSVDEVRELKRKIGADSENLLVVATGGGLGARSINEAMLTCADDLLARDISVYHITGKKHYDSLVNRLPNDERYQAVPFVYEDMDAVLGAADIVVCRGSATTLQELAGLAKATVIVPAHQLSDQIKNAEVYAAADAGVVVGNRMLEQQPLALLKVLIELAADPAYRETLGVSMHKFAKPQAATDLAKLIVTATKR